MAFSRKVYYRINFINQFSHKLFVTDIAVHKAVIGVVFDIIEVFDIACISECIKVYYFVILVFVKDVSYKSAAYKASTACYE